jgi:hypothetical protein
MSSKLIVFGVCVLLLTINSASAKSWRGLEPLHSTRADDSMSLVTFAMRMHRRDWTIS